MTFRNYLIAQAFGVAAFNATANAGYTWFLWGGQTHLSPAAVATDLATTPIWIGLLSVLLGTIFIRRAFADGTMLREAGVRSHPILQWLPRSILIRAILVASLCALAFALPLSLILPYIADDVLTPSVAISAKVILTLLFSLLIVPLVIYVTTADAMVNVNMRAT